MNAARIHRFGPPDVITVEQVDRPDPAMDEVLVKVEVAGVGPWDAWIRTGNSAVPQPLPLTLGSDFSGTIVSVGSGVTEFRPGEAVFGVTNHRFTGAQAEYAVALSGMIAAKPERLTHEEAASVPIIATTAWQALFEQARSGPGQRVLILGAAGNVGAYAVQLAKSADAYVIAVAHAEDHDFVRSLGADEVIDGHAGRFEDQVRSVDTVLDLVGGEPQQRALATLRPGGHLVSAVSAPDRCLAARYEVRADFFLVEVTTLHLTRLAEMLDAGALRTRVGAVLNLAEIRQVHEMLDGTLPRPKGKIVLQVAA